MKVIKVNSYSELSKKAANIIAAQIIQKPNAVLGLATGSTPVGTYKELIKKYKEGDIDFSAITSVNLDEYFGLDGNNDQSYRFFMNTNLFDHVNIDKSKTNVPSGVAVDPEAECKRYDELIENLGGIDLQLLGLGPNGHIGFNEPDDVFIAPTHVVTLAEKTIEANKRFFKSVDDVPKKALTMGIGAIMKAKKVLLIVSGSAKNEIVGRLLTEDVSPTVPASVLQLHPDVTIIHCPNDN